MQGWLGPKSSRLFNTQNHPLNLDKFTHIRCHSTIREHFEFLAMQFVRYFGQLTVAYSRDLRLPPLWYEKFLKEFFTNKLVKFVGEFS